MCDTTGFRFISFGSFRSTSISSLRFTSVPRPYRIPLGTFGCILLILPPSIMTLFVMAYATKMTYAYISGILIVGVGIFELQKVARRNEWCEYVHVARDKKS
jgi:hypothetical protein